MFWRNGKQERERSIPRINSRQMGGNKNEYVWCMELKNEATGLGWNDAKGTVDCSKEWWDEHLVVRVCIFLIDMLYMIAVSNLHSYYYFRDARRGQKRNATI